MESKWVKLKDLVGQTFTINAVPKYSFKYWDNAESKMLVSDVYKDGYRKLFQVETDKGTLDLSSSQLGSCLEAAFYQGTSNLIGKTFEVKSNGKDGIDIRYFFNLKPGPKPTAQLPLDGPISDLPPIENYDQQVNSPEIPF